MTIEKAQALCKVWQERLRLQDWRIDVRYVRNKDLDGAWGRLKERHLDNRWALIQLVEPDSFVPGDYFSTYDVEETLVHELLHLYTEGILGLPMRHVERDSHENYFAEQLADAVSEALVKMARAA